MEYLIGFSLAIACAGLARFAGFDRDHAFYPVLLIVIASYYCLFAVMGGSGSALWIESGVAALFAVAAVAGFRTSLWIAAAGIGLHGAMDLVHAHLVANPGVPPWWPGFCSSFDLALAAWLALRLVRRGDASGLAIGAARD